MKIIKRFDCECGKTHETSVDDVVVKCGAIKELPFYIKKYNSNLPFIIADINTYDVCGKYVEKVLKEANINFKTYFFNEKNLEPDEYSVGSAFMHFDKKCDMVIGVGSGVINDIGKIVSNMTDLPYIIVGTAPSMDGYASATSSMSRDGLKISLPSKCANVIIGDLDILKNAPMKMMVSGLGDMLAKYVSICEWRISNLINGEYYCEKIAEIIRNAVKQCVDNAEGLLKRDVNAVEAVFNGLVLCGVGMNYAGCSRPASGVEHYFSHVWDMRGLEFKTPVDFHGIQCAIGTLYALKIYEQVKNVVPNREKAIKFAKNFNYTSYEEKLKKFLGKGADSMITLEKKEGKYDIQKHEKRIDIIIEKWDKILKIINEELIPSNKLSNILDKLVAPKSCKDIGIEESLLMETFNATKDIRDKYVLSRLCWDLGIIDEIKF